MKRLKADSRRKRKPDNSAIHDKIEEVYEKAEEYLREKFIAYVYDNLFKIDLG